MKVAAILLAAGHGSRLGAGEPKAFVPLAGTPLLIHSLRALASAEPVTFVAVVVPANERDRAERLIDARGPWRVPLSVADGGIERQDSVRSGLVAVGPEAEWVAIHDAARPFVSTRLIDEVAAAAVRHGAALAALPATDTPKLVADDGSVESTLPRARVWLAQTPQIFRGDLIRRAHAEAPEDGTAATDDAMLVERLGVRVQIVAGDPANRKITTAEDLSWAEWWMARDRAPR